MEAPQIHHTHHKQQHQHLRWKSHAHDEDETVLLAAKVPRLSWSRDALRPSAEMVPPVGLGLGLRLRSGSRQPAFTVLQLQELELQALIFKYMVAGVPVPLHLVLPIWKSMVSSPMAMFQPSSLSGGGLCFDFRNSMEPELGRCRRTDGKKWRCSREVVPDHKYCEKHMHRERNRSRKPVERQTELDPSKSTDASTATPTSSATAISTLTVAPDSSAQLSVSIPDGLCLVNKVNSANNSASVSSSPRLEFSPTSVLPKVYYGSSVSESSSGSTAKTESNFC